MAAVTTPMSRNVGTGIYRHNRFLPLGLTPLSSFFFFFNDTATTEIYTFPYTTLFRSPVGAPSFREAVRWGAEVFHALKKIDRKSTRLNSSHLVISYAVFCLKKKKHHHPPPRVTCSAHVLCLIRTRRDRTRLVLRYVYP